MASSRPTSPGPEEHRTIMVLRFINQQDHELDRWFSPDRGRRPEAPGYSPATIERHAIASAATYAQYVAAANEQRNSAQCSAGS